MALTIYSFGYLHEVPEATVTVDLRAILRDSHIDPALRYKTAADAEVRAKVAATRGALDLASRLRDVAAVLCELAEATGHPTSLAIGCAGGRHRSAALTMLIADDLTSDGHEVTVNHLHIDRPVVERPTA
jgi:UPF0042 nucleotide-binding protein